jgi:hypothetical protein
MALCALVIKAAPWRKRDARRNDIRALRNDFPAIPTSVRNRPALCRTAPNERRFAGFARLEAEEAMLKPALNRIARPTKWNDPRRPRSFTATRRAHGHTQILPTYNPQTLKG